MIILIHLPKFTGGKKYEIKGCAGTGGFAQVYKSYLDSNPDDVVALKVENLHIPFTLSIHNTPYLNVSLLDVLIPFKCLSDTNTSFSLGILHLSST